MAQTFPDWELIILDDGSIDGTSDVVRKIRDPRIHLITYSENRGLPNRLNEVIRISTGEFFARMDGDDVMYPDRLTLQHKFLQEHPDVDLVGGAVMVFRGSGIPIGIRGMAGTHEKLCGQPWRGFPIVHPTWMGRASWFRENKYPEDMVRAQDQALLLRSFAHSRFAAMGNIVLGYREEPLRFGGIMGRRYHAIRAFLRHGGGFRLRMLAVTKQIVAGVLDAIAIASRFEYSILHNRAASPTLGQVVSWERVWAATDEVRDMHFGMRRLDEAKLGRSAPEAETPQPAVTIVMPVWNCGNTIALAISSVLNQDYNNWELLVIDDGSTDLTVDIAKSTGDARIRVLSDGAHRGLPARLNQGVSLARSDYIARMDGDDIMYPERLTSQIAYLTEEPLVDLLATSVVVFRSGGVALGKRSGVPWHEAICSRPEAGFHLPHPSWMGRTEFFRKFPYRADVGNVEDQELLFRAHHTARLACLPELLMGYREDRLRLRNMLRGRLAYARVVVESSAHFDLFFALRALFSQGIRAIADTIACVTGLNYLILRQRARTITTSDVEKWRSVWNRTLHTAATFVTLENVDAGQQVPATEE
jgi:glycosyltransferase involved in cell wall biosynthesis